MNDILYAIKQQQLEKCCGELRALISLHYDPMEGKTEEYKKLKDIIENFISDLKSEIG